MKVQQNAIFFYAEQQNAIYPRRRGKERKQRKEINRLPYDKNGNQNSSPHHD